jgi:putative ABC transport system permease protein
MTLWRLVLSFIGRKPVSWAFHALVLAVAIAVGGGAILVRQAAEDRLRRDLAGVDLVVGARGSPLQLVMSSLLHVDVPTGNIPLAEAERMAANPLVSRAVPLALGDSVGGARIAGTSPALADLYGARLAQGRWWSGPMQAVLGARAAQALGLKPGSTFRSDHGLEPGADHHHTQAYVVVGVLRPTGAAIDRLVLTDLSSIWALHEEPNHADEEPGDHNHDHDRPEAEPPREVTSVLVTYRSPLAAVTLPRAYADRPDLMAAAPAREAARLNELAGMGARAAGWLALALLVLSATGFVVSLAAAILSRSRDLALLKALGAGPGLLFAAALLEGLLLGLAGGVVGLALARIGAGVFAAAQRASVDLIVPPPGGLDLMMVALAAGLGLLAALGPALLAARADPTRALGSA